VEAIDVLRRRLAVMNTSAVTWGEVANHVNELSQAELVRAAEAAAKKAILQESDSVTNIDLVAALEERRMARHA
jgi:ATP-dependent 26S proteasome regulatory subunit